MIGKQTKAKTVFPYEQKTDEIVILMLTRDYHHYFLSFLQNPPIQLSSRRVCLFVCFAGK